MARRKSPTTAARLRRTRNRRLALRRDAMATPLHGIESLERRSLMAVDILADDPGLGVIAFNNLDTPFYEGPDTSSGPLAAAGVAPTNFKVGYAPDADVAQSDAFAFVFGETPQPGDTWQVLENGVPIAVNTRYYRGLPDDTWETTIEALPFDTTSPVYLGLDPKTQQPQYRARESWDLPRNPVVLPTAYGLRGLTAGNRYEIQVIRDAATATGQELYGRFKGASASGVGETQTGTVSLLDLDYGRAAPAGVGLVRGTQGEQVAAVVLDAGKKVTLRLGEVGVRTFYTPTLDVVASQLKVEANRAGVVKTSVAPAAGGNEWTLTIDTSVLAGKGGIVSLRITNTAPGSNIVAPRYLGVVVKDSGGHMPAKPEWLSLGAVNTNTDDAQNFFRGTAAGDSSGFKSFDTQYIYLNDGPLMRPATPVTPSSPLEYNPKAWRTSSGGLDGKKLIQALRESAKFGAVPQIVYYNIMAPNESQPIALANLQNRPFMVEYFKDLKFTVDTIRQFASGTTVSLILEPDLLAYMMQSAYDSSTQTYRDPSTIAAMTDAAYEAGLLPDPGVGNRLPNTLPGFVEAINRGVRNLSSQTVDGVTQSVNLEYGWKFNLWAYALPAGGSVAKITDTLGWQAGRAEVQKAASSTADWYVKAGILTGDAGRTMDFIALDKYGTDGGATPEDVYPQNGAGYTDPSKANFFWNADHWNNYLLFAKTLHDSLNNLPVRLWQLPVGHVNGSEYLINGKRVADLANTAQQWEDSAVSYFFGDAFSGKSSGRDPVAASKYFASNLAQDPLVTQDADGTIVWGSHMAAARDAGIESIMFGPGLANSTQGGGYLGPALDGFFWAAKSQDYLKNPLAIPRVVSTPGMTTQLAASAPAVMRVADGSIPTAAVTITRTGDTSRALTLPVKVVGGTAAAGSDFSKQRLEKQFVRFKPGESSAMFVVPTLRTRSAQPLETLRLRIGGASLTQPTTSVRLVLGSTARLATSTPVSTVAIARLTSQMRSVETFSDVNNPGRIVGQLKRGGYPDPTAANEKGEVSGTNGLAAYPLDGRNTPGAFQVDLFSVGGKDKANPWLEQFGEWKGNEPPSAKGATPFDTQIAFSKSTLSEFFGIEVNAAGLITRIPAAAAAVFLHNEALAFATQAPPTRAAWDPSNNPLTGQHIDAFQTEQLSLYLAGRLPTDGVTGVNDTRTAPQPVLDLANALQQQVARSYMYATYQKFDKSTSYSAMFSEVKKYFGATLKMTASTAAFGVEPGEEFWCRLNGSFVVAGSYVSGEGTMANLLTAFVAAAKTGVGTWVIDPKDPAKNVTFTRVTPAGTPAAEAIFTVDKTPLNVNKNFPSVFHYGAVVSPLDAGVDWNDKAAWGIKDRNIDSGIGYARLGATKEVSGATVVTQPGRYLYSGIGDGQTLTLSGSGPFYVYGRPSVNGPVITNGGYGIAANNNQSVAVGGKIDIAAFGMTTPQEVFDASFYGWYSDGLQMAKVNDPTVPANLPLYLYFVPAAGGDPANVKANVENAFYDTSSPYSQSARVAVASVAVLGRPVSAEEWAANFFLVKPAPGTGTIDASQAWGNVFIIANDSVQTVKLGDGPTAVTGWASNTAPKTYVLNPIPMVGSLGRPFIGLRAGDTIDARGVIDNPTWVFNNLEQSAFDNKAATGSPYMTFSAFSRYQAFDASGNRVAEFAGMLQSPQAVDDPAAVVRGAVVVAAPSLPPGLPPGNSSDEVAPLLRNLKKHDGVKGRVKNRTNHPIVVVFGAFEEESRTLAPGQEVTYYSGRAAYFEFRYLYSSHTVGYSIFEYPVEQPSTIFEPNANSKPYFSRYGWDEEESHDEIWGGTHIRGKREKDGWKGGHDVQGYTYDWAVFTVEIFGV